MKIRFKGADGTAPSQRKNEQILPHLAKLFNPTQPLSENTTLAFADSWVKDPEGAIATLGDVFQKAIALVKEPKATTRRGGPQRREDAAFVEGRLSRYLSFFRREFWDARFPGQLLREFTSPVRRSDETLKNALSIGLPPRKGAWQEATQFIRETAAPEFFRVIQALIPTHLAETAPPTPPPPKVSHRRWHDEDDGPPLTSWHINDYPPKEDDFLD